MFRRLERTRCATPGVLQQLPIPPPSPPPAISTPPASYQFRAVLIERNARRHGSPETVVAVSSERPPYVQTVTCFCFVLITGQTACAVCRTKPRMRRTGLHSVQALEAPAAIRTRVSFRAKQLRSVMRQNVRTFP